MSPKCHPNGLIVASSYEINNNNNNINFNMPVPNLLFARQEKKSIEALFFRNIIQKGDGKTILLDNFELSLIFQKLENMVFDAVGLATYQS